MRCVDFANHALEKGANPVFLSCTIPAKKIIETKGFRCFLIAKSFKYACKEIKIIKNNYNAKTILLDINYWSSIKQKHQYFDFLKDLKALDFFLITFEDLSTDVFPADIVIIPYVGGEALSFHKSVESQYLLGPKFFQVREEFLNIKINKLHHSVDNILITMGGSDENQMTAKVVKALSKSKLNVHLIIVLGSLAQVTNVQVNAFLSNYNGSFEVINDAQNMAELMNKSQLAITNSGLTKYEMGYMGLPAIVISNNSKHASLMDDYTSYGSVVHLGDNKDVTEEVIIDAVTKLIKDGKNREKMSKSGRRLVDGKGVEKIYNSIPKKVIYA